MHVTNLGGAELPEGVFSRAVVIVRQGVAGLPVPEETTASRRAGAIAPPPTSPAARRR